MNTGIDVLIFVRLKKDNHCIKTFLNLKPHTIVWNEGNRALAIMDQMFYESYHSHLIKYPFLSCMTEIQKVKPKMK